MADFAQYVASLPKLLAELNESAQLHVTVGNESCDLDSMVSAVSHAHYLHAKGGVVSLPLFSCKRADFDLRTEAREAFSQVGVQSDSLVFSDDLPQDKMLSAAQLKVTLVDHNSCVSPLREHVVEVIDHHQLSPDTCVHSEGVIATVERVGSCSTLVASQLLSDKDYSLTEPVVLLLLSAILLDTGNLQAEGIVTDKDKQVASQLQELLPKTFSADTHFKKLFSARFDISALTTPQVLARDYKQTSVYDKYTIGFSSITADLAEFVQRDGFNDHLRQFFTDQELSVLLLLGIHAPDGDMTQRRRQLSVYQASGDSDLAESVVSMLEANEELHCVRQEVSGAYEGILLEQGNVKLSRKHVLPLVTQFVTDVEKQHSSAAAEPLDPVVTVVSAKGEVPIPEYSPQEESQEVRTHRYVSVAGDEHIINMTLIEPYKKIVQHAGYVGDERMAVMVVCACYLPPRTLHNYRQVAQELFYYIMSVLDRIIVDQYMIVYLHSGAPRNSRPSLHLLHKFYQLVDRRFRKQLMHLHIVHPTFFVKSILTLARPFISTKFWRKVNFVPTLAQLPSHIVIDNALIPTVVKDADSAITRQHPPPMRYSPSEDK